MYEHNALGYWSGLALCLTKVRSSRARCPATALIQFGKGVLYLSRDTRKPGLWGFQPGLTQTGLSSYRRWLEA